MRQSLTLHEFVAELREARLVDESLWRAFHCECCRRIWSFVNVEASRQAIMCAEEWLKGRSDPLQLAEARKGAELAANAAWKQVCAFKHIGSWTWPLSEEVDLAWVDYCCCSAALECVQDVVGLDKYPDSAASVVPWKYARRNVYESSRVLHCPGEEITRRVAEEWEKLKSSAEEEQKCILVAMIDGLHLEGHA